MGWTRDDASHLLMRAGLGGSVHQVEMYYTMGRCGAVEHMLDFDHGTDPVWDAPAPLSTEAVTASHHEDVLTLIYRLLNSRRPLQSRLTWFWLDHFTPAIRLAGQASIDAQAHSLRAQACGQYKAFLPAMYRDGVINGHLAGVQGGREPLSDQVMLRQATVRHARAGTTDTLVAEPPVVSDATTDRALIVRRLFDRPDTMREVCAGLYRAFVGPFPDSAEMIRMIDAWQQSGGRIADVVRTLLRGHAFWDARVRGASMKGALEFVAGLVQRLNLPLDRALVCAIADNLSRMGHWLMGGPHEGAQPGATRAPDAAALMQRYAFARHAVFGVNAAAVADGLSETLPRRLAPQAFITLLSQRLGIARLTPHTRALVTDHLGGHEVTGSQQERVLGALYLLICAPEYQRC